jgi:hypothetical protein
VELNKFLIGLSGQAVQGWETSGVIGLTARRRGDTEVARLRHADFLGLKCVCFAF